LKWLKNNNAAGEISVALDPDASPENKFRGQRPAARRNNPA
jgi:hypothetical protein